MRGPATTHRSRRTQPYRRPRSGRAGLPAGSASTGRGSPTHRSRESDSAARLQPPARSQTRRRQVRAPAALSMTRARARWTLRRAPTHGTARRWARTSRRVAPTTRIRRALASRPRGRPRARRSPSPTSNLTVSDVTLRKCIWTHRRHSGRANYMTISGIRISSGVSPPWNPSIASDGRCNSAPVPSEMAT